LCVLNTGYAAYGHVLPTTLAWRQGCSEWLPVAELEELSSVAAAAQEYLGASSQPDAMPSEPNGACIYSSPGGDSLQGKQKVPSLL
jgi:GYF domain 2